MAIAKIIKLEGDHKPFFTRTIKSHVEKGRIKFDNVIQRSYVWENSRKSKLIWSAIMGYPIPPIYARRFKDALGVFIFDVLDGQQRLLTFVSFLNDEFALVDVEPIPYIDENGEAQEYILEGKKFSELDDEIKEAIEERTVLIYHFDDINQAVSARMFRFLNNGKPLSASNKALASCSDIINVLNIGEHEIFKKMLTQKSRDSKNQASYVMKSWLMMTKKADEVSFDAKRFASEMQDAEIPSEDKVVLLEIYNLMYETHEVLATRKEKTVAKKLYTQVHFISLIPFFKEAVEKGYDSELLADWLCQFFGTTETSVSEDYNKTVSGGTSKAGGILTRDSVLRESFDAFFEIGIKTEEGVKETTDDDVVEEVDTEESVEDTKMSLTDELLADMEGNDD